MGNLRNFEIIIARFAAPHSFGSNIGTRFVLYNALCDICSLDERACKVEGSRFEPWRTNFWLWAQAPVLEYLKLRFVVL